MWFRRIAEKVFRDLAEGRGERKAQDSDAKQRLSCVHCCVSATMITLQLLCGQTTKDDRLPLNRPIFRHFSGVSRFWSSPSTARSLLSKRRTLRLVFSSVS